MMKSIKQFRAKIVIDTPNLVFRKGEISIKALNELLRFIKNNTNISFIVALTPKLLLQAPLLESMMTKIAEETPNVGVLYTYNVRDPDECILRTAMKTGAFVLSNDRFRQDKYDFFNKDRVLRYMETDHGLIIKA